MTMPEVLNQQRSSRWLLALALIFLLALTVRLGFVYLVPHPDNLVGDSVEFDLLARNLLAGHGLSYEEPWRPSARKTPLYPWLLAQTYRIFGPGHYTPLLTLQAVLDALLVVMLAWLAMWAWQDDRMGLLAAGLWAIYLPGAQLAGRLLADSLFGVLQFLGFSLFIFGMRRGFRSRDAALLGGASGLSFGLAALTRPTGLYAPLLMLLALVAGMGLHRWRRKKNLIVPRAKSHFGLMAASMLLLWFLTLIPWTVRNYRIFHQIIPGSTLVDFNFYFTHRRLGQPDYWHYHRLGESLGALRDLARKQGLDPEAMDEAALFRLGRAYGLAQVRAHPDRFFLLSGRRVLQLWFNLGYSARPSLATLLFFGMNLVLLMMAFWAEFQAWRHRHNMFSSLDVTRSTIHFAVIIVLLYYTAGYASLIAYGRYIIPAIPFLIILSAGAPWRWIVSHGVRQVENTRSHVG